jgi:hypothetical protein
MQPGRALAVGKQALGHTPEWVMEQVLAAMGLVREMGTEKETGVVTGMELEVATALVPVTGTALSQTL